MPDNRKGDSSLSGLHAHFWVGYSGSGGGL